MTREIILNTGKGTLVDDTDFDWLNDFNWRSISQHRYVARIQYDPTKKRSSIIYMHREIMGHPSGLTVDHRDHDGFNNQRANLRIATQTQQLQNRSGYGASKYKGVRRGQNKTAWMVVYFLDGEQVPVGVFYNEIDAARAYDAYAAAHGDEFTFLNFPDQTPLTIEEAIQLQLQQHRFNPSKERMTSQYRGVSFYPTRGYWRMGFRADKDNFFQRYFKSEIEAARAYDTYARKYHGPYARLNFPNEV